MSGRSATTKLALLVGGAAAVIATALFAHRRSRNKRPPPRKVCPLFFASLSCANYVACGSCVSAQVEEQHYKFPAQHFKLSMFARRLFTEYAKLSGRSTGAQTLTDEEIIADIAESYEGAFSGHARLCCGLGLLVVAAVLR
jgi:hypothetical protein